MGVKQMIIDGSKHQINNVPCASDLLAFLQINDLGKS
jgi:hypothetical protein